MLILQDQFDAKMSLDVSFSSAFMLSHVVLFVFFSPAHRMRADTLAKTKRRNNNALHQSRCCAVLFKAEPNDMHKRKETGSTRDCRTIQCIHKMIEYQINRQTSRQAGRQNSGAEVTKIYNDS